MKKRIFALCLCFCLIFSFAACSKPKEEAPEVNNSENVQSTVKQENPYAQNSLTGLYNLDKAKQNLRPVAIMIDNDSTAQRDTQSGIGDADIVYETETEGGITRLMAVFADISRAKQLGDVRSARYVYVDLAMGHNAIYIHSGKDMDYCKPHLEDLDNFEITYGYYGERIHYGNARNWQELFTTGETLVKAFADKNWKTTAEKINPWQTFAKEDEKVNLTDNANKVTVKFSSVSTSYFTYDSKTEKYIKTSRYSENKDRNNGADYSFKNVFVLKTKMDYYPGNYRRKISLESGEGYYCVNGKSIPIKWKKGNASDPFVFTNVDGTPLKVNCGNSWVCIAKNDAEITFE